jgi:hypothetical protein
MWDYIVNNKVKAAVVVAVLVVVLSMVFGEGGAGHVFLS